MMKRLYLLRHAQAQSTTTEDKLRPLSEKGREQAHALKTIMDQKSYVPNVIGCSPAERTKETLSLLFPEHHDTDYPEGFYYAMPGDLLTYIQNVSDDKNALLIVNHNPAIHKFAFMMVGHGPEADIQSLSMGYRPCTLTVLDCLVDQWQDIVPGENTLVDLIPPSA